jgi:isoleucyl-tRNA synthetase
LKRVPEVFDCWFESGSMPYAQQHYPFENEKTFEHGFPADFIAEGLDQTRGWFYTLMVISTALFNKPAFKNLICNGLVLAADGKKMSKRLKNYPDPMDVVTKHGADALRVYLINSPVVRAEPLRFKEEGVRDVLKEIFIPWYNTYRLFVSQARRLKLVDGRNILIGNDIHKHTDNVMDRWILSAFQSLVKLVSEEMSRYRLDTVMPHLLKFIDQLSRWFVRFNKTRMKGDFGPDAASQSLGVLFHVLLELCKLMAPFTPFFVEYMYQNLAKLLPASERKGSVHYCFIPKPDMGVVDEKVEQSVSALQSVIDLGRSAREKSNQPSFPTLSLLLYINQKNF